MIILFLIGTSCVSTIQNLYGQYGGSYNKYKDNWYGYYSVTYRDALARHKYDDEILHLETNLYDVRTEKLIWSAVSSTYLLDHRSTSIPKEIQSFIKLMIKNLSEEKLI
jgi:hypothetical protein